MLETWFNKSVIFITLLQQLAEGFKKWVSLTNISHKIIVICNHIFDTYWVSYVCDKKYNVTHLNNSPQLSPSLQVQLEITQVGSRVVIKNAIHIFLQVNKK